MIFFQIFFICFKFLLQKNLFIVIFSFVFSGLLRTILQVLDWIIHRSHHPIPIDDAEYESGDDDSSSNDDYETASSDEGVVGDDVADMDMDDEDLTVDDDGFEDALNNDDEDEDEDDDEEMPDENGPEIPPGDQNPPPPPPPPAAGRPANKAIPDAQLCLDVSMMNHVSSW